MKGRASALLVARPPEACSASPYPTPKMKPVVQLTCFAGLCVLAFAQPTKTTNLTTGPVGASPAATVPRVPRFPLGLPGENIASWDGLPPAARNRRLEDIKPVLQRFVDYDSILGVVTLVDRAGKVQLNAVGVYRPDTIFQVMSMAKPFVSVTIMKLVEEGKISSVDARVCDLPGLADFPYRDVTVRQLLTHTSGIWPLRTSPSGGRWGVAPHLTNAFDKDPATTTRDKTLDFVARHYANPELYPPQGNESVYSNIGYMTLG